jgi:hypothetical protein
MAMKQLPDILTSATFWAALATLWAASGAWFTYVASEVASRKKKYDGILSLIKGLEAELALVSEWASGEEGAQGYPVRTRLQLVKEHPDWFNPSRMVFKFSTPRLNDVTNSPYVGSLGPIVRQLVTLNHSIRRLFDSMERYQAFVMGNVLMYQSVMEKLAPKTSPVELASSTTPTVISVPYLWQIKWTPEERAYINIIFMMNEGIHQTIIGGVDSGDACLYKSFRIARTALQEFKEGLKREPLPDWFQLLHIVAGALAWVGFWQLMRWFGIW